MPDGLPVVPPVTPPTPWWKDNENQKDIATALGVAMELFNAYLPVMKPGIALGIGILLRAGLNYFGGTK